VTVVFELLVQGCSFGHQVVDPPMPKYLHEYAEFYASSNEDPDYAQGAEDLSPEALGIPYDNRAHIIAHCSGKLMIFYDQSGHPSLS
jgi:hypothetical protein